MSRSAPSTRRPRGRVVVVGGAAAGQPLNRDLVRAGNLFEALGEVTVATASAPIAAVLVPAGLARGGSADAFHRIDPAVRVLLVAAPDADGADGDGGFDGVLQEPVDAAALDAILDDREEPAPRDPVPTVEVRRGLGSFPGAGNEPGARAAGEPRVREPLEAPGARLGDIDLVDAILGGSRALRERAVRLAAQETGWADLALDEPPAGETVSGGRGESGSDGVPVRYGGHEFGLLRSPSAGADRLRPWAEWLARWLALERTYRRNRMLAYHDELTGAGNRRFFDLFMRRTLESAAHDRRAVTVMVFDIDDFKQYNDQFGHEAGDEVLIETVRLLNSVIRSGDRVCRIGGDEFVVIFSDPEGPREPGSHHPRSVEAIASRFQSQITQMKFPKLGLDAPGSLSVSGGLATYPWDGTTADALLRHADHLALESKRAGKNVITLGQPAPPPPPPPPPE